MINRFRRMRSEISGGNPFAGLADYSNGLDQISQRFALQAQLDMQLASFNLMENIRKATGINELMRGGLKRGCSYCGRTNQNPTHKSCDGCGAPREN